MGHGPWVSKLQSSFGMIARSVLHGHLHGLPVDKNVFNLCKICVHKNVVLGILLKKMLTGLFSHSMLLLGPNMRNNVDIKVSEMKFQKY